MVLVMQPGIDATLAHPMFGIFMDVLLGAVRTCPHPEGAAVICTPPGIEPAVAFTVVPVLSRQDEAAIASYAEVSMPCCRYA